MKKLFSFLKKINWTNTLFLTITPLVAIAGAVHLATHHAIHWQTVVLTLVFTVITGLSITAGYHRLFSHNSYKAALPVRLFFLLFGAAAFEGSALEWSTDHRNHHRYTDKEQDPYNSQKGFWYAHFGWLLTLDPSKRDYSNVKDLAADKWNSLQHKYIVPVGIFGGFILPTAIAGLLWGDWLGGLCIASALRITLNQHFTFCINSVCHWFGKQTYSDRITAKDNWITALFTYGEGYHNFHHQFPLDYRNGIRAYDYDPTKWLISGMHKVGLASDLRQVSQSLIVQYRLRMDEQNMLEKAGQSEGVLAHISQAISPLREAIHQLLARIEDLEKKYAELKKATAAKTSAQRQEIRQKIRDAQRELKHSLAAWAKLVANTPVSVAA